LATARIVSNLVNTPLPLGYSSAGFVSEVGSRVPDISPGQRVACAGLGYANHAESVFVPRNLIARVPDGVSDAEATFVTVGAIAMHGVRQAELTLGEFVVILGMGLVGQIAAQICKASGCRVFCVDVDGSKVELAKELGCFDGSSGAEGDLIASVMEHTRGVGADAVIITAGTKSSQPIHLAPKLSRDRGRVVAVGDIGHDVPRRLYYDKEIDLKQSRSYGPGRYDPSYEEGGRDYPIGYVRWTENRNMELFLELVSQKSLQLLPLVTHRYPIEDAKKAYSHLDGSSKESYIAILLEYDARKSLEVSVRLDSLSETKRRVTDVGFAVVGAGQFAQGVLLPALRKVPGTYFHGFATSSGLTTVNIARKFQAPVCTSDYRQLLDAGEVSAVLVATRHDTHAQIVSDAMKAGKHCFVEKPLAINQAELNKVIEAHAASSVILQTGYNRRFSPLACRLKEAMSGSPLVMQYRINAGFIPGAHWHQDDEIGGGRIVGEICHFVDLMQYLCGAYPASVSAIAVNDSNAPADPDNLVISLTFFDGSVGSITYAACGDSSFPKERLEVFGGGRVGVIDGWRSLVIQGNGRHTRQRCWFEAQKGFREEMNAFVSSIRDGEPAISFSSQVATARATFGIQTSIRTGRWEPLPKDPVNP